MKLFQVLTTVYAVYLAFAQCQNCDTFTTDEDTEVNTYTSVTILDVQDGPPIAEIGYTYQIYGVNSSGWLYSVNGLWDLDTLYRFKFVQKIDLYNSYISYDSETNDFNVTKMVQNEWVLTGKSVPTLTDANSHFVDASDGGDTIFCPYPCSHTYNDNIYAIRPYAWHTITDIESLDLVAIFNMSSESWEAQSSNSLMPTHDDFITYGCTTAADDAAIIYHFNVDSSDTTYNFAYDIINDEWITYTPNPDKRNKFSCAFDDTGRYIYILGGFYGDELDEDWAMTVDRYDTHYDEWEALNTSMPDARVEAKAVLDSTTQQIMLFGGRNTDEVTRIDFFDLESETWVDTEVEDEVHLNEPVDVGIQVFRVSDFSPNGELGNDNTTVDMMFVLGGGYNASKVTNFDGEFSNLIQFVTVASDRKYYSSGKNYIVAQLGDPASWYEDIPSSFTFDAYQRYELTFKIVTTDNAPYDITDEWDFEFTIDGQSLTEINDAYDTGVLVKPLVVKDKDDCPADLSKNVEREIQAELMIPSHRTLNNGYCAEDGADWMFAPGSTSTITLTIKNPSNTAESFTKSFDLTFSEFDTIGSCEITSPSDGLFETYRIQCDGFEFKQGLYNPGIGETKIEYNLLMNDVKLSQEWAQQWDNTTYIEGVEGFDTAAMTVLVRGETGLGEDTWYQECMYDVNITHTWSSLDDLNSEDTNYMEELWAEAVGNLNEESSIAEYVAAFGVIEALYAADSVPEGEDAQEVITEALEELIAIDFEDYSDDTDTTLDYISTVITLVELMTEDADLIANSTVLTDIIGDSDNDGWLLDTLELTLSLVENSTSDSAETAELVQTIGTNADNAVENIFDAVNETGSVQQVIENYQKIMEFELEHAWEDEVIINKRDNATTKGETTTNGTCSSECGTEIVIPDNNAGESDGATTCVTTCGEDGEVAVDLKKNGTKVYRTNDTCFPFLIKMHSNNAFDKALEGNWTETSYNYPECVWFNGSTTSWDGEGCVVYNFTEYMVTCACTHLTTFKVTSSDFDPKADVMNVDDIRALNTDNLQSYPTTWVTMLMILVILVVACICVPNNSADKPIIAFEDIIYKEFRDQYLHKHQQWHEIQQIDRWYTKIANTKRDIASTGSVGNSSMNEQLVVGQHKDSLFRASSEADGGVASRKSSFFSVARKKRASKYYWLLSWNLFQTYLKNDHTVLSVFQRTDGTNFSSKQRIGMFLLYMYMIMMATAIFYGREGDRQIMGDIAASALISLIGTCPVYLIRVLFQWSKPRTVPSARQHSLSMVNVPDRSPVGMSPVSSNSNAATPVGKETDGDASGGMEMIKQRSITAESSDNEYVMSGPALVPMTPMTPDSPDNNDMGVTPTPYSNVDRQTSVSLEEEKKENNEDWIREQQAAGQMFDTNIKRRTSTTYWNAVAELKKASRPDMKLVRKCMTFVNGKTNNSKEKAALAAEVRLILFDYNYPFPRWFKKMAWGLTIACCVLCVVFSVSYGIQFDIGSEEYESWLNAKANLEETEDNSIDCSYENDLKFHIQKQLINNNIERIQANQADIDEAMGAGNYDGVTNDSTKWLLDVLLSFLLSVFIWQPLSIYQLTWLKIWAFHNGLIMEASVYNLYRFLCCCFAGKDKKKNKKMMEQGMKNDANGRKKMSYVPEESVMYREMSVSGSGSGFAAAGGDDRALDLIGFLCNDELFVELPDDYDYDSN